MQVGIEVENVYAEFRNPNLISSTWKRHNRHSIHGSIFPSFRPVPDDRRAAAEIPWSERREKVKVSLGYFFGIDNIRNIMKPCMQVGIEVENVYTKFRHTNLISSTWKSHRRHSIHGSKFFLPKARGPKTASPPPKSFDLGEEKKSF